MRSCILPPAQISRVRCELRPAMTRCRADAVRLSTLHPAGLGRYVETTRYSPLPAERTDVGILQGQLHYLSHHLQDCCRSKDLDTPLKSFNSLSPPDSSHRTRLNPLNLASSHRSTVTPGTSAKKRPSTPGTCCAVEKWTKPSFESSSVRKKVCDAGMGMGNANLFVGVQHMGIREWIPCVYCGVREDLVYPLWFAHGRRSSQCTKHNRLSDALAIEAK